MKYYYKILYKINKKLSYFISLIFCKRRNTVNIIGKEKYRISKKIKLPHLVRVNNCFMPGKRIKIFTKAPTMEVQVIYKDKLSFAHMSELATSGVDIYIKNNNKHSWYGTLYPSNPFSMKASKQIFLGEGFHNITFYLPPFAEIKKLLISTKEQIEIQTEDKNNIVVYGSSISQGCAASRPALSYVNILSRMLDINVLNYGFSEGCRGEKNIIQYISNLNAKVYILEYDHNSSVEELKKNHKTMYETIRQNNKESIIILLSRLSDGISISKKENDERVEIISNTYKYAQNNNDKKIFFINGSELIMKNKDLFFVDDRHPNDLGMNLIAEEIFNIIKKQELI